jgi:hypothetical protein
VPISRATFSQVPTSTADDIPSPTSGDSV